MNTLKNIGNILIQYFRTLSTCLVSIARITKHKRCDLFISQSVVQIGHNSIARPTGRPAGRSGPVVRRKQLSQSLPAVQKSCRSSIFSSSFSPATPRLTLHWHALWQALISQFNQSYYSDRLSSIATLMKIELFDKRLYNLGHYVKQKNLNLSRLYAHT